MRSLVILALAAAAYLPLVGNAQDWLVLNGLVQHLSGNGYCNAHVTKGLGLERASGDWRGSLGFYDNSNCAWSAYAAAAWLPAKVSEHVRLGIIGGVVSGYRSPLTPAAGLAATYEGERYGVNVIGIPPLTDSSPGVIWFQFKVRLR